MAAALPGVLAVMDSDRGDAVMARAARYKAEHAIALERRSVEARAAVAELIECDLALDAIDAELPCLPEAMPDPAAYLRRRNEAQERRHDALARVQGVGA